MRTKTLLLSSLLGALSGLSMMAQSTNVYSLNAVGYINVTLPSGFSIIADQLIATPNNEIGNVLPAPQDGTFDGTKLYKFSGAGGYKIYTLDSAQANSYDFNPGQNDPGTNVTLNPGEAAFFNNNSGATLSVTFVGTVPQGTNTVAIGTGFNLISSPVPQSGLVTTTLGFPVDFVNGNQDGDKLYLYNAGYTIYTVNSGLSSGWGVNANNEPSVNVGQGFFYLAQAPVSWTRVFSVNQ